jgi:hypothetical protein
MRVIIRAMPARQDCMDYLSKQLPDAEWCIDKTQNAMDTFAAALQMAGNDACIHMEEDVILTNDFMLKIMAVINCKPNIVIQFFSMRASDVFIGSRFDANFMMGQCFYMPPTYSKQLLEYKANWQGIEKHPTGLDTMLADFLKYRKEKYWIEVPNLVDHKVGKSMIDSRRSSKRQSLTFQL